MACNRATERVIKISGIIKYLELNLPKRDMSLTHPIIIAENSLGLKETFKISLIQFTREIECSESTVLNVQKFNLNCGKCNLLLFGNTKVFKLH